MVEQLFFNAWAAEKLSSEPKVALRVRALRVWSFRVWPSAPVPSRLLSLCEASLLLLVLPEALVGSAEVRRESPTLDPAFTARWLAERDMVCS